MVLRSKFYARVVHDSVALHKVCNYPLDMHTVSLNIDQVHPALIEVMVLKPDTGESKVCATSLIFFSCDLQSKLGAD